MDTTEVVINPAAVRPAGDHVVSVSPGIGGGLALQFNEPMAAAMSAVADGSAFAWFVSEADSRALISAMQQHLRR